MQYRTYHEPTRSLKHRIVRSLRENHSAGIPPTQLSPWIGTTILWALLKRRLHRDGHLQLTETPRSRPMTAVTAIAKAPPIVTRNAARPTGAPPRWPPNAPSTARLTRDKTAIAGMPRDRGAMRRAAMGTVAKDAKLVAEIHPACSGRARDPVSVPSSSRRCEPNRSRSLSC